MEKGSPKQKQSLLKLLRARIFGDLNTKSIPELEKLTKLPQEELLPSEIASNPSKETGPRRFVLRFDYLNLEECKLQTPDETRFRGLLRKFVKITSILSNTLSTSGIIRGTISRASAEGEYANLFRTVPLDQDFLVESGLPGEARLFFFVIEENCYIVVIDTIHRNVN